MTQMGQKAKPRVADAGNPLWSMAGVLCAGQDFIARFGGAFLN